MKRICVAAALFAALLLAPALLFAQAGKTGAPSVILVYYEDVSGALAVKNEKGVDVDVSEGMRLQTGWTLLTDKGDLAELKLDPNGTIIKVSQKTNFKIDALQGAGAGDTNAFSVALGKIRTVAGKATGNEKYTFKGSSAVCGVRGTDFGMDIDEGLNKEEAFVLSGEIDYSKFDKDGKETKILLGKGQKANAFDDDFKPIEIPPAELVKLEDEMQFKKLKPVEVPGHKTEPEQPKAAETASGGDATPPKDATAEGGAEAGAKDVPTPPSQDDFMAGIIEKLKEMIGLEIGSITIGDKTYSKALAQPYVNLGKFKAAFYLPLIYSGDMFDVNDWYKPEGNNEWSFGTDVKRALYASDLDYWLAVAGDASSDLFLKIRYLEWGDNRDPFFFKVGNLNDITVGHGLIMRNFANDADFPALRRIGLNLGLDLTQWGFEAMVNDVSVGLPTEWDIVGGRVYLRPAAPAIRLAIGASLVADLNPTKDMSESAAALVGNPIFLNPGLDIDLPFLETDFLSIVAFADGSLLMPLFKTAPDAAAMTGTYGRTSATPLNAGLVLDAFWQPNSDIKLKNWGVAAGLFGNILIADWRVEFRDYTGFFKPQFYSTGYERLRTQYVQELMYYLADPTADKYDVNTMGVYGEGGFSIPKVMDFTMGYFWPWSYDSVNKKIVTDDEDRFTLKVNLAKGLIPVTGVKDVAISALYERTKFVTPYVAYAQATGSLTGAPAFALVDANTIIKAEVAYTAAPTLDIVLYYTAMAERDAAGNVVYDTAAAATATDTLSQTLAQYLPKMTSSISIETRIHF